MKADGKLAYDEIMSRLRTSTRISDAYDSDLVIEVNPLASA